VVLDLVVDRSKGVCGRGGTSHRILRWVGIASPLLYFGSITVGCHLYPGFDLVRQVSSELGARNAPHPLGFNVGLMLFGAATALTALQLRNVLNDMKIPSVRAGIASGVIALFGFATLMAGSFPLPDWKHAAAASLGFPNLLGPWLLAVALRIRRDLQTFRVYLVGTNIAMALAMAFYMALAHLGYPGLGQLLYSFTAVPWIGVSACVLSRAANREMSSAGFRLASG